MRLHNDLERAIYAAAFVRRLEDLFAKGPDPSLRERAAREPGFDVSMPRVFEATCADTALQDAYATVHLHREASRRRPRDGS